MSLALLDSPDQAAQWLRSSVTAQLHTDSRKVRAGDGLIAWPGAAHDARQFVPAALQAGATACLVEHDGAQAFAFDDARIRGYHGLKAATGPIAARYFNEPSRQLELIAITGTNGKTSTAWWLAQALSSLRTDPPAPCGVIGTLGAGQPPALEYNGLTTPDPVLLQQCLRGFVDAGFSACAIEASSIGIAERRLDGSQIAVAVFTNFTQDHLDYHGSMQAYWQAKAELFRWPGLRAAVVNIDDAKGAELVAALQGTGVDVWTVSCTQPARLQASAIGYDGAGLGFAVAEGTESGTRHHLQTQVIGDYNVANLLCVLGTLRALGITLPAAVNACASVTPVPGRMDCTSSPGQPLVAVDYAHTPDALDKALQALRPLAAQRGGALWCVFGCGGDRDAGKRPLMAAIAQQQADHLVLTSDNPRSEQPEAILAQMQQGLREGAAVQVQTDRAEAIANAVAHAAAADVILLAGKGHETWQEIAGVRHPFSDKVHAETALALRRAATGGTIA
ncbi:MAG: UDP-N-acetylmuramoyl-L-alanyl-D-glutamate--2,6-diaminopimelate ligase [Pseudomonadota bacterium]